MELFRSGLNVAAIAREIDPQAQAGAQLQQRSKEVQSVLRQILQQDRVS